MRLKTHKLSEIEKQSKIELISSGVLCSMLLFKLWNINETSYQQHFFFVLYLSNSLSLPLMPLWALFLSPSVHTPGSHLLLPYFHPPLYITLYSPAVLDSLPLIFSPLVSLYFSRLLISTIHSPFSSSSSSWSPSFSFFFLLLSVSLSLWLSCRPFLSRSPTVGKQLIMGGRRVEGCGEG